MNTVSGMEARLIELIGEDLLELEDDFGPESNLFEAGLNSMAIMQLLLLIEEEFGVSIPVAKLSRENFSTPSAIATLIRERQAAG